MWRGDGGYGGGGGDDSVATLDRIDLAEGPPLAVTDWAGNTRPCPPTLALDPAPSFVAGLPVDLLLTRLSLAIADDPPLLASRREQPQEIVVANHTGHSLPLAIEPRYAVRLDGTLARETAWRIAPARLSGNLPPADGADGGGRYPQRLGYEVRPGPNTALFRLGPGGAAIDDAEKLVRLDVEWRTDPPVRMNLYRTTRLTSEIDLEVVPSLPPDRPGEITLLLRLRYFPAKPGPAIMLRPFYAREGEPPVYAGRIPAAPRRAVERGDPRAPFDAAELTIRRERPVRPTVAGLVEEDGPRFLRVDITPYLRDLADGE